MTSQNDFNNMPGIPIPAVNNDGDNSHLEPLQNNGIQLEIVQNLMGNGNGIVDYNRIGEMERGLLTHDQKRSYLIQLYDSVEATRFSKETLSNIATIVRTKIVRNVKFIQDENTCGLSKDAIEKIRRYPSYWKPDLTKEASLQMDIFNEFPEMTNGTLYYKVQAWKGMREKVIHSIRAHRNATQTQIQSSILSGKSYLYICLLSCSNYN